MRKSSNSVNDYFYILNLKIYVTEKILYRFSSIRFQAVLSWSIRLELQDNSGQTNKLTTAMKTIALYRPFFFLSFSKRKSR